MSVEQLRVIDIVSHNPESGVVSLTISDHLEWDDRNEHLLTLQEKINTYLAYVEGGELISDYPQYEGMPVEISIKFKYRPNGAGKEFISRVSDICKGAGIRLRFTPVDSGYYNEGS